MGTTSKLPNYKLEEIPVMGGFIIDRVEKDLDAFTGASPDINQAFIDALNVKQKNVTKMVTRNEKTGEIKEITKSLYAFMNDLNPKLDLLEIKLKRAVPQLGKPISAFGLPKLRKNIKGKNADGLLCNLEVLLREIDNNTAALEAKGFTADMREEFASSLDSIDSFNKLQNKKMDERGELSADNKAMLVDYWHDIAELMSIGKLLYKKNPVKKKEYTFTVLRARLKRAHKKAIEDEENGTAEGGGTAG